MSGKGAVGLDECMPKIVDVEGGGVGVLESGRAAGLVIRLC